MPNETLQAMPKVPAEDRADMLEKLLEEYCPAEIVERPEQIFQLIDDIFPEDEPWIAQFVTMIKNKIESAPVAWLYGCPA
jgi:lipopolysaccharide biosynthesis regulator YciM